MRLEKRTLMDFSFGDVQNCIDFNDSDRKLRSEGYVAFSLTDPKSRPNIEMREPENPALIKEAKAEYHEQLKLELIRVSGYYDKSHRDLKNMSFGSHLIGPDRVLTYARINPEMSKFSPPLKQDRDYLIPLQAPAGTVWYMLRADRK